MASIHIGTSGWSYPHWRGHFYPQDLPSDQMLTHYADRLSAVEVNGSFYRMPTTETFEHWRDSTPEMFLFALKANRGVTHTKKLKDAAPSLRDMLASARILGNKLGPILFQLPPQWRADGDRLAQFLREIPNHTRTAFEFRNRTWFDEDILGSLRRYGAAFCIYDLGGTTSPLRVTSDFVYVRLHGPDGPYQGSYDRRALSRWAEAISDWHDSGKDVFCFFDNDEHGYAAANALDLRAMLENRL